MSLPLKLLERPQRTFRTILPSSTTPDDIRGIVQFLDKKPAGIAVGGILDGIFDPRKIAAYELLEIIVRDGKRLKLSSLGRELAEKLEPETQIFRFILNGIGPYRSVLERAHQRQLHLLMPEDVAVQWLELYPRFFDTCDRKITESMAVCFFQLCQAAALGQIFTGKEETSVCLHIDGQELAQYLSDEPLSRLPYTYLGRLKADEKHDVAPKDVRFGDQSKFSINGTTNIQTVALKILSHALVEEIRTLDGQQDAGNTHKIHFADEVRRFEAELIRSALAVTGGRQRRAADLLNMSKTALNAKIKRYRISSE